MLSATLVIVSGIVWLGVLFAVAVYGERHPRFLERRWAIVYALSLAVHCTSWTFLGNTTQASRSGWWVPPNFVGAIAMYVLGIGVLFRLVRLAREHNSSSLADLISTRLGRSPALSALITAVMLLGMLPYIALQMKAVAMSFTTILGDPRGLTAWRDGALWVALSMALFAIVFGTRRSSAVAHNRGLVLAIAFESVFKLVAMLALTSLLFMAPIPAETATPHAHDLTGFASLIVLGALAMFTLPHQFHTGVVECRDVRHLVTARWLFPLYMVLISVPALPLARLGDAQLAAQGVPSDLYLLALPLAHGERALALLAFLGSLSASTCMVVVATLALSLMVANHVIAPLRLRAGWGQNEAENDLRGEVLWQRRAAIVVIIALAWAYSRVIFDDAALADIGALAFSALGGLAPTTWAALYRPQLGTRAVFAGLAAGTLVWMYTLLPGVIFPHAAWLASGPFGFGALAPTHLFGLDGFGPLTRAVVLGIATNLTVIALVELFGKRADTPAIDAQLHNQELRALASRFLSGERAHLLIGNAPAHKPADATTLAAVEHELSAVIGASSARLLLDVARRERRMQLDTVAAIVDEASADLRFSQRVLLAALENMSQGICVVDAELRVVAWNRRYAELFRYPPGLLCVGRPVGELTRHSIAEGMIGADAREPARLEAAVQRRLAHMRAGTVHLSERRFPDGSVVEIRGNPMPGGGFVATFNDVTEFRRAALALERANETLELRVAERTAELEQVTHAAEAANATKTRFLAAVSHDLMQPLHAAQLFAHSLAARTDDGGRVTARHLHSALAATESLLGGLLDMARLDAGKLVPRPRAFALNELLEALAAEFDALASEKGLSLHHVPTRAWVRSDPHLLRRVLQNFLSNALCHVESGRVLLGCRRVGNGLRIEVWDTGPGIAEAETKQIFEEFRRGSRSSNQGLGLGLAIARGMARLLDHDLSLRSWPGRGSVFAVGVPRSAAAYAAVANAPPHPESVPAADAPKGRALIVDNEPQALTALRTLLEQWGWSVLAAVDAAKALDLVRGERPDIAILDYHLAGGANGLDLYSKLQIVVGDIPAAILTADRDAALRQRTLELGLMLLYKPLKPLALKQVLQRSEGAGVRFAASALAPQR
ncbi:MAG: PAS domain-containing hybrid sensor histidine kinase/response regulator [Proteobacteria bacterium]|nr:PAS domain-containing hybrid sensor histidine kinase/response regulator [Pseudomonadota bacterium]